MPNYDDNEFKEIIESETGSGETGSAGNDRQHGNDATDAKCYICGRPESVTGPLMRIPNNICICKDCMQKTFDSMNNAGFPIGDMAFSFGGFPNMNVTVNEEHTENDDSKKEKRTGGMPNISMINLSDLAGMMPGMQRVKKKKPKKEKQVEPVLDIHSIPAPHKIKAKLDEYVVGQEHAKKVMSVAVYNHYKRIFSEDEKNGNQDGVEIEKSNMLMVGPTGCGKTYLVKTLAQLLDVPLAITDATSLTEAGYIGDDIESVVSKLLAAADNDVERAEHGIIFIDEIDKIAKKKNAHQRDVSGESVQQGMLKLLEGAEVEVPVGASSKNAMVPMELVNTKNILFICGGAFPELEDIIKERLNKNSSMGFQADLKDKYDNEENLLKYVTVEDIRKFGMIPEFIGRLPILFSLDALTEDMLVRILTEPKNAIVKQYQKLLSYDEVALEFEQDALDAIAKRAKEKEVGARALRAIIEEFMLDIMYEIPKDDNIGRVVITRDYIENHGAPRIIMRGVPQIESAGSTIS